MAYRQKTYKYNDKLTLKQNTLLDHLFKFKVSHMASELERLFLDPNTDLENFETNVARVINYEWDQRHASKVRKLANKASLKYPDADFDQSLYESDRKLDTHTIELLESLEWIDEKKNLLITGSSGAGKTYIANAFCVSAMNHLKSVKYIRAATLLKESEKARKEGTSLDYINEMSSFDLLVIDDFGMMELDLAKCSDLFEILETRDSRKSTIIAAQLPVKEWWNLFADSTYADACLSRITGKAYRLECNGRDMRQE